jgi:predicted permease
VKDARRGRRAWEREDPSAAIREELDAHFEGSVELLVSRGWTEEAARSEVRRRFGNERRHRAALEREARLRSHRRRAARGWHVLAAAIRAAARDVARSPGLSLAIMATLALGLGANAAIFRVVDRLLLSAPPHVEDAAQVRRLHQTFRQPGDEPWTVSAFSYADIEAMRGATPGVRFGAIMSYVPETVGAGASAVRLRVARVDSAYLPLVGVRARIGRELLPEDHRTGAAVAVLSHSAWQTHFGGDPAVLGRSVRLARGEYEVIGIMPRGFHGAHAPATDLWIPVEAEADSWWGADWRENPMALAFSVLVRLPRGTNTNAWDARMAEVLRAANAGHELRFERVSVTTSSLVPGSAPNASATISVSRWLAGVSLLVLLVACANAANLFLAHGERRRRETAVRRALGAGASALRAELLTRSLLLALCGAVGAVLFALWGGTLLEALFLSGLELPARPATSRLLVFTGAAAIVAALVAGVLPALRAPRCEAVEALQGGVRATGRTGAVRRILATVQVALCMVLLVGTALFVGSFRNALQLDLGFAHDRLIMLRLERDVGADVPRSRLYELAQDRIATLPAVAASSPTVAVPFVLLYGLPTSLPGGAQIEHLHVNAVGADFFSTMGVPMLRGRIFHAQEEGGGAEPVVIVSRRTAERVWPGRDPLGECLHVGEGATECSRVIGVAGDHAGASYSPGDPAPADAMQAWVPLGHPAAAPPAALLVRTAEAPAHVLAEVRRVAATVPGVRYVEAELLSDMVARELRSWHLGATVFSFFSVIALLVAGVGLYGVLAFEVAQRQREFGIRAALGASPLRVLLPIVRFAWPVVTGGVLAGAIVASAAAVRVAPLLYRLSPRDPAVYGLAAACVVVVACAALMLPAIRAARTDPRRSLG